ncbi:MAG: nuclear transport factor 2 family protein, partial [Chloroflexota bacterium]|nr:nuclear transport factor 2 family protein [Chloroflexota bacterium]
MTVESTRAVPVIGEHPNATLVRRGYEAFATGDFETLFRDQLAPDVRWHLAGRNQLAGDHNGADEVRQLFMRN